MPNAVANSPKPRAFIAAPMSSLESETFYDKQRTFVLKFLELLESAGLFSDIYFAGREIDSPPEFTAHADALLKDYRALLDADIFILLYPAPILSSVLVETGIAIGLKKKSYLLCHKTEELPFILRKMPDRVPDFPMITIIDWKEDYPEPSRLVDQLIRHCTEW
jgi:hypothetical protein